MGDGLILSAKFRGVHWTLAGIFGLLVITAVSIVPFTLTILHLRLSDARVIDMAGRQRMLLERHMKELLLAACFLLHRQKKFGTVFYCSNASWRRLPSRRTGFCELHALPPNIARFAMMCSRTMRYCWKSPTMP